MKLSHAVAAYVAHKKALGMRFATEARTLKSFCRALGNVDLAQVHPHRIRAFLDGQGPMTPFWHRKLDALRGFYGFATARRYCARSPLPTTVPRIAQTFVPYVYSEDEVKRLLEATAAIKLRNLSPLSCRTMLLLLYGTGLRISEALGLDLVDVDLDDSLLRVRDTKFYKNRLVPIGPDLTRAMAQYALVRKRQGPTTPEAPFLLTRQGKRLSRAGAELTFKRLRERAHVYRADGSRYQPRLHDFRCAFAVTRLVRWYREGADVQRLLPQLATYLGHVHIAGTQRYLTMTPELLRLAGRRFERYALGGDEHA